jgi:pyruvate/2-oxoglutarate dehydrogenase complex dihydrolipoamide acyltransferase (E2) component
MKVSIRLPRLSMNMEEGVIVQWHKPRGAPVQKGDPLYAVETEKASVDVEAPCDGVLATILHDSGSTVAVGDHVCVIETSP